MKNETARREIESLDYYLQNHTDDYSEESHTAMMMAVKALEQEPKAGHWIKVHKEDPNSIWYRCSSCDRYFDIPYKNKYPFCSMCGAKMSEAPTGAESENKG